MNVAPLHFQHCSIPTTRLRFRRFFATSLSLQYVHASCRFSLAPSLLTALSCDSLFVSSGYTASWIVDFMAFNTALSSTIVSPRHYTGPLHTHLTHTSVRPLSPAPSPWGFPEDTHTGPQGSPEDPPEDPEGTARGHPRASQGSPTTISTNGDPQGTPMKSSETPRGP